MSEYHTYFVGDISWGFSVWSHNTCWIFKYLMKNRGVTLTDDQAREVAYLLNYDSFGTDKAFDYLRSQGINVFGHWGDILDSYKTLVKQAKKSSEQVDPWLPRTEQLGIAEDAARHRLTTALGGRVAGASQTAHHILPVSLNGHEVIQRAARGGFNVNGADNGVWLDTIRVHRKGDTHPAYTAQIKGILDKLDIAGMSDQEVAIILRTLTEELANGLSRNRRPINTLNIADLLENPGRYGLRQSGR